MAGVAFVATAAVAYLDCDSWLLEIELRSSCWSVAGRLGK